MLLRSARTGVLVRGTAQLPGPSSLSRTGLDAISRFYDNCKQKKPGKKGYPRFQHDNRSVEYKTTGWKLEPDGKHITFTDGCGIGRLRLIGNKGQRIVEFSIKQVKRVRLISRADGY